MRYFVSFVLITLFSAISLEGAKKRCYGECAEKEALLKKVKVKKPVCRDKNGRIIVCVKKTAR